MIKVLFVCVHNGGRSVMAEAFARAVGLDARSAGTVPQPVPHPEVVEAMGEVGIDVSGHRGELLTDEMVGWADHVITMGCAVDDEACPAIRLRDVRDWGLADPKGRPPEEVRAIRDEIRARVAALRS
ncbi:MAG: arsenate reductase ArsC [Actinomycetota bacterium]